MQNFRNYFPQFLDLRNNPENFYPWKSEALAFEKGVIFKAYR